MLLGVIENIWDFILKQTTSGLTLDLIFYIGLGFIAIMVIFFIVKSYFAYEGRLERSLDKLNRWLYAHQQIDESNLVEFNSLIKKSPKLLRYHWQQYMLYREKDPSAYMSVYNCIEKPLHTSSYTANIKNFTSVSIATMLVTFVLSFISFGSSAFTISAISMPLLTPAIIYIISMVCLFFLRMFQNVGLSSLYQNFHLFNRYIDKASTSIPKYVDFEILFTRQEIRGGIPVLNEYLEKRARQEAEELEKARENAIERETYDFSSTGIDGSLVLDRAMKESEVYLNARQRILSEIRQYESEIDTLRKNYENTSKDYQRKLQASKENVERLRAQQEESTNRIEVNYIRKQQQDEIKKQEQLEKDQDSATTRYNQEVGTLSEQIAVKKSELEEKRLYVQSAMLAEYQTFANKLFDAIQKDVSEKHKMEIDELSEQKVDVIRELEQAKEINQIKDSVIEDLKEMIKNGAIAERVEPVQEPVQEEIQELVPEEIKEEIVEGQVSLSELETEQQEESSEGYYDDNGYYWYPNGTYYDNFGYYHDEQGDVYDSEGNYISPEDYQKLTSSQQEETVEQPQEVQEEVVEEVSDELVQEIIQEESEQVVEQPQEEVQEIETVEEQPVEEEIEQPVVEETQPEQVEQEEVVEETAEQENQEEPVEETVEEVQEPETVEEQPVEEEIEQPVVEETTEQENQEEPVEETVEEVQEPETVEEPTEEQPQEEVQEPATVEATETEEPKQAEEVEQPQEVVAPAPKKRGRPRKNPEETTQEVSSEPKKRGRPRKNPEEKTEQVSAEPKKRGRPRKVQVDQPQEEVSSEPKKRGRPRKNPEETQNQKPTAKRGRPRKTESASSTQAPKTSTGKRGRPRKTEENKQEAKTTAKRGRPRKTTFTPKTEGEKRRGRPRKQVSDAQELQKINTQILEESNRLMRQQEELNRQLGETLNQMIENDSEE